MPITNDDLIIELSRDQVTGETIGLLVAAKTVECGICECAAMFFVNRCGITRCARCDVEEQQKKQGA